MHLSDILIKLIDFDLFMFKFNSHLFLNVIDPLHYKVILLAAFVCYFAQLIMKSLVFKDEQKIFCEYLLLVLTVRLIERIHRIIIWRISYIIISEWLKWHPRKLQNSLKTKSAYDSKLVNNFEGYYAESITKME